ncbi:MAG: hypothetical protein JOZ38_07535 [Candidatus Eremiobacteraeota bacterium]|nr:hypothetical protein [Candidatus Eremiobacteraeota bacterium]
MKVFRPLALLGALALLCGISAPSTAADDMLTRMIDVSSHPKTLEASIHVDIALHTFPYISPSLDGTYYHKDPSKDKIAFDTVPSIAKQFNKIYPRVESPSRWNEIFVVTPEGDSDGVTMYKLVPRIRGRIDHIDVKVDDKTATISEERWTYNDGGFALLDQSFTQVDGDFVLKTQTGHLDVPNWKADLNSTFSNYKLNPPIPDSIFTQD